MNFKTCCFLLVLLLPGGLSAQNINVKLHAETWDIPRHGEVLLKISELSSIIHNWMESPRQKIELRYPGGEEGELWVEELKDWFISLGVPSRVIQVTPGSNAGDIINIVLVDTVNENE